MNELCNYLQNYLLIPQDFQDKIAELFVEETFEKGQFYIKKNQYAQKLSFVRSGYLRIYDIKNDKEITQWLSGKGYFVADLRCLTANSPARWNIQAITECSLFTIHQSNYEKIGRIMKDWVKVEKLFLANCFVTLEERVFSLLAMSAEERYEQLFHLNPSIFNEVPNHYLASMLNMTPETFSRIRKKRIT